jgi:hypothetical protein
MTTYTDIEVLEQTDHPDGRVFSTAWDGRTDGERVSDLDVVRQQALLAAHDVLHGELLVPEPTQLEEFRSRLEEAVRDAELTRPPVRAEVASVTDNGTVKFTVRTSRIEITPIGDTA